MKALRTKLGKYQLAFFFLLVFLFSWILWVPLIYGHFKLGWTSWEGNPWNNYRTWLGMLGSLGPSCAAIVMTYLLHGKVEVNKLLKRVVQWRVNFGWWAIGLYSWWIICSVLAVLMQIADIQKVTFNLVVSLINIPAMIFVLQLPLIIGMFGEEVGWRGYALPRLLDKFDPVIASLILALPWIVWHAPLAVFQDWRGNTTLLDFFINYFLLVIPLSIIFTWFFQKTKGSLLLVILLHKSFNLTFNAYPIALRLNEDSGEALRHWSVITIWGLALLIVFHYYFFQKKRLLAGTRQSYFIQG